MARYWSTRTQLYLYLIAALFCASCALSEKRALVETIREAGGNPTVSKEAIVASANIAAREHGWRTEQAEVVINYDEGNVWWKGANAYADRSQISSLVAPVLHGHDWGPEWGQGFEVAVWEKDSKWQEALATGRGNILLIQGVIERHPDRTRALEGHDYQAVRYTISVPEGPSDEQLWVLVDRNTGEVLWATEWP